MSKNLLGEDFENKLALIHIKIERLKKEKISTYIYSFIYLIISFTIIISQINFLDSFDFTYSRFLKLAQSLLIILPAYALIIIAINKLKRYKKKVKDIKYDKDKMVNILKNHQIKYSCSVKFGKKYHGIQDVHVYLKSNSNLLKESKMTFQI